MHPNDNLLRAMLDHELPEPQAEQLRLHLSGCPGCQSRLATLQVRAGRVQERLDVLSPGKQAQPINRQAAFARVMRRSRPAHVRKEFNPLMANRKPLWTALAVIAILVLVFTLTPARAWASDFLGLFRVERIAVVEIDPLAAQEGEEALEGQQEVFKQLMKENMTISEGGDPYEVASLDEAAAAAGFTPGVPAALQEGKIEVKPAMHAELTINQPEMQALLDVLEVDVQISPELDGEKVITDMPTGVVVTHGCAPGDPDSGPFGGCTSLYQMPGPVISAPEGLNVEILAEAGLKMLGYSALEARALSRTIDWTSTLVIPIPSGEGIRHQDVTVSGVPGTLITHEEEGGYMLLWVKNNMLYSLRGPGSQEEALEIGNSIP